MKELIIKQLSELPQQIYDKEIDLMKKNKDLEELDFRLGLIETKTKSGVLEDSDKEEFKKQFSSDVKRKDEVKKRMSSNNEVIAIKKELLEERRLYAVNEKYLSLLKRQFRSAESLARLGL